MRGQKKDAKPPLSARTGWCFVLAAHHPGASRHPSSERRGSQDRGMILIVVLWIILILSLISVSLAAAVRVEVASSQQSFDSERAFFMAKGAAEVVYNAYEKNLPVPEGGPIRRENGDYVFPFDAGEARVRFESNAGLIDLNAASDPLLASMFDSLGVSQETRNRLVDSILDWRDADDIPHLYGAEVNDYPGNTSDRTLRPRNGSFQSVDELLLVKNMTPELFYGSVAVQTLAGQYQRVPGARELVTVNAGSGKIDANEAAPDVLRALPSMTLALAERIASERAEQKFAGRDDLAKRIPELAVTDAIQYLSAGSAVPSMLVSRATITSSGVSRTVRLSFSRQERTQMFSFTPPVFRKVVDVKVGRWRFD